MIRVDSQIARLLDNRKDAHDSWQYAYPTESLRHLRQIVSGLNLYRKDTRVLHPRAIRGWRFKFSNVLGPL